MNLKMIKRILKQRASLMRMDRDGTPKNVKGPLYSKYPANDQEVI